MVDPAPILAPVLPSVRLEVEGRSAVSQNTIPLGLRRGLQRRCPNCGEGSLFAGYLKVLKTCPRCGNDNGRYRAHDGPAYFTILIVGHVVVAPLFAASIFGSWSPFVLLILGLPLVGAATLLFLPFIKGGWIGLLWATSSPSGHPSDAPSAP